MYTYFMNILEEKSKVEHMYMYQYVLLIECQHLRYCMYLCMSSSTTHLDLILNDLET